MEKLTLFIDMDGVTTDFDGLAWEFCIENKLPMDIADRTEQTEIYLTDHVIGPKNKAALRREVDETNWFARLDVIPGAQEKMEELHKVADVWICTKPLAVNRTCLQDKRDWIHKHFPYLTDRMFIAPDKSLLKADLLLDDAPRQKWIDRADWGVLVYSQPYNTHQASHLYKYPHYDWSQPIDIILETAERNRKND